MPRTTPIEKRCLYCNKVFVTLDNRTKYCGRACGTRHTNKLRSPLTAERREEINRRIAAGVCKYYDEHPEKTPLRFRQKTRKSRVPNNLFEMSRRTRVKIVERLSLNCFVCGWDEDICDVHHIYGRRCGDPHNHSKLSVLCPNHHRLAHRGKIKAEELPTIEDRVGNGWLDAYYWATEA